MEEIPLTNCSLEPDGTINCKVTKEKFDKIQGLGKKPRRVIFEIE